MDVSSLILMRARRHERDNYCSAMRLKTCLGSEATSSMLDFVKTLVGNARLGGGPRALVVIYSAVDYRYWWHLQMLYKSCPLSFGRVVPTAELLLNPQVRSSVTLCFAVRSR